MKSKKGQLILQLKKELHSLEFFGIYGIAEDIFHSINLIDFSDSQLDSLLSQKNLLEKAAIEIHDSKIYDELITSIINQRAEK